MKRVLFVGWDAADWKAIHPLLDAGRMPHLQGLVERGSMSRVATLHPPLSPMLWTSIATGKRPFKHGIHGFSEPTPDPPGTRPITNLSRTSKAVWNILNQNGLRSVVIGWWPSHPAEPIHGVMVSNHYHKATASFDKPWPLPPGAVHPPELREPLAGLRMHPQELVWDTLKSFVPALEKVDQEKDSRIEMLATTLAECISIHCAATWLLDNQPWDFFGVYYDAIDHFCHGFMRYHPPRRPDVSEEDFELYSNVVSAAYQFHDQMLGTLLSKTDPDTHVILMSDHGFHPDHLRPGIIPDFPAGPAVEHSPYGIFAMAGPGIRKDERVYGVNLLDLAPTLLALYGLPAGEDMDGRVIADAFETPPQCGTIPSWEDVPGDDGQHPPHTRVDSVGAAEALAQLAALGYIEKPGENAAENSENAIRELRYNLMESYQDAGRHAEALEIARDLCARDPDDQRYAQRRFLSCQALGLVVEMREIVSHMDGPRRAKFEEAARHIAEFRALAKQRYESRKAEAGEPVNDEECRRECAFELAGRGWRWKKPPRPLLTSEEHKEVAHWRRLHRYTPVLTNYLKAQTQVAEKRWFEALETLSQLHPAPGEGIPLFVIRSVADLYRRLGRLAEAETGYRAVIAHDPDNAIAFQGLARTALRRRDYQAAAEAAHASVARLYFQPVAHVLLAAARIGLREYEGAATAIRTALTQNPHFPIAHLLLARLLKFRLGNPEEAQEHFSLYLAMRKAGKGSAKNGSAKKGSAKRVSITVPRAADLAAPVLTLRREPLTEALPALGDDILVVSGLPRSGTSMLMQMLAAGGVSILTDGERAADEDNPRGYFEFEAVKKMFRNQDWLTQARGKAVKIVVPLVNRMPKGVAYRVILLERNLDEVLDSQAAMIQRRGEALPNSLDRREVLRREYQRLMENTGKALSARPLVKLLPLRYEEILACPGAAAAQIDLFAGGGLDRGKMAFAMDLRLHRQRSGSRPANGFQGYLGLSDGPEFSPRS